MLCTDNPDNSFLKRLDTYIEEGDDSVGCSLSHEMVSNGGEKSRAILA